MPEIDENIEKLYLKIEELKQFSELYDVDIDSEIEEIRSKINEMNRKAGADTAWNKVLKARKQGRPGFKEYINTIFNNFIELKGDRLYGDDCAIACGIAYLEDFPVTVIGTQKGHNLSENIERNFGMVKPEGYRKALRLMKQAEKFSRPVICFVDTAGAFCGVEAEERGEGEAIARNLYEMSNLKTPIISVITGEGGSGGALALSVADRILMLENSIYSVISPEGCASILLKDSSRANEAAEYLKLTALDLKKFNIIDEIIEENDDLNIMSGDIKTILIDEIEKLKKLKTEELLKLRYKKIRSIGNSYCTEKENAN